MLGAFVAIGPLTIDMYLPALPTITEELETTSSAVQLTLTGTLIGLALGQLRARPAVGRAGPPAAAAGRHRAARRWRRCWCSSRRTSPSSVRCGCCRASGRRPARSIAIAIVRDLYDGRAAATMLSRLFLVLGAAPVLAPTIGGELLRFTSWRGVFAVLAAYGVADARGRLLRALRETLPAGAPAEQRRARHPAQATAASSATAPTSAWCSSPGSPWPALFSYVSGSAFVYQGEFGLDEQQFGLLFGAGAFWLIAATQLNPVLLRRWSPQQMLVAGTVAGAVAAAVPRRSSRRRGTGGLWAVAGALWAVLVRLRAGAAERARAGAVPARRGGRHRRGAARRHPVRRRRRRLPGRRPAGQRRGGDRRGHRRCRWCSRSSSWWSSSGRGSCPCPTTPWSPRTDAAPGRGSGCRGLTENPLRLVGTHRPASAATQARRGSVVRHVPTPGLGQPGTPRPCRAPRRGRPRRLHRAVRQHGDGWGVARSTRAGCRCASVRTRRAPARVRPLGAPPPHRPRARPPAPGDAGPVHRTGQHAPLHRPPGRVRPQRLDLAAGGAGRLLVPRTSRRRRGTTDSERYFLAVAERLDDGATPEEALRTTADAIAATAPFTSLNCLLLTPEALYAFCR